MEVKFLENEVWYGPWVFHGAQMPFDKDSEISINCLPSDSGNQVQPLMLSNKGRYIWDDEGFNVEIKEGVLNFTRGEPTLYESGSTLRDAFKAASAKHFPPKGTMPPEIFISKPQYNDWIEIAYDQTQENILKYAHAIIDNGYPAGILMIDDNWSEYYGGWRFNRAKFPDPKAMMDELHGLGFKVMLWICPFIGADREEFREARGMGMIVHEWNKRGIQKPKMVDWWNGFSAVLDFSNPATGDWLYEKLRPLIEEYGVDGFKLDAGDPAFYAEDDITFAPTSPNKQCEDWAKFGLRFPYNEYRACFKCAGEPLVQRLCDKNHRWLGNGIDTLIPHTLAQGILGYAFGCPDMIGGGDIADLSNDSYSLDTELFIRNVGAAALLPMMQFSAAPWRVLPEELHNDCKKLVALREKYIDLILNLTRDAAKTGEPVARYLEYVFPGQGLEKVIDEFMIGDTVLVAPVVSQGADGREVILPEGKWKNELTGEEIAGGTKVFVKAGFDRVPVFTRV